MAVYWFMFSIPLLAYIFNAKVSSETRFVLISLFLLIFSIVIGFRYEVGGDWDSYLKLYYSFTGDAALSVLSAITFSTLFTKDA